MTEQTILIEKGKWGTNTMIFDDILEKAIEDLDTGEHLIVTIKKPTREINGVY